MAVVSKVIGLMSGTSLDGVDAALLETDGETVAVPGAALTLPYAADARKVLKTALEVARDMPVGVNPPPAIVEAERLLTAIHTRAVARLLEKADLHPSDIAYLGFHGQTILHRPEQRRTWQLGDGPALARATGIAVVNEFRSADVGSGGQGAPFVPLYHDVLTRQMVRPVVVVNIGGVANVTYAGADGTLIAFDTGPGNAAIDDWALQHTGIPVDRDGALARTGKVIPARLEAYLDNAFFDRKPPKSLDRLDFPVDMAKGLSPADGAATLTAITAASIARAQEHMPHAPRCWIICGGGRHNPVLMSELRSRLPAKVISAEDAGWRGDFLEAEAFAYLAMRSVNGMPLSLPSTTGVPYPMKGGRVHVSTV